MDNVSASFSAIAELPLHKATLSAIAELPLHKTTLSAIAELPLHKTTLSAEGTISALGRYDANSHLQLSANTNFTGLGKYSAVSQVNLTAIADLIVDGKYNAVSQVNLTAIADLIGAGKYNAVSQVNLAAIAELIGDGKYGANAPALFSAFASISTTPKAPIVNPIWFSIEPINLKLELNMSHWKTGDLEPPLKIVVRYEDGTPVDLTDREVEIVISRGYNTEPIVRRMAEIVNAVKGEIMLSWQPGDTDQWGTFLVSVRVDGKLSSPTKWFGTITIEKSLLN